MKKHILLIDDDRIMRENTADILRFAEYKVSIAVDGRDGVEKVKKEKPDLILCDVLMPKLDGFAVYQILSKDQKFKNIPFIFLTAKNNNADRRRGMELGADDYIIKPFDESRLLTAIAVRLEKSRSKKPVTKDPNLLENNEDLFPKTKDLKELVKILQKKKHHSYKKGENIFCEGNRSGHVYLVKDGIVKTYKNTPEGKELITGLFKKNHFIGYTSSLGKFPHTENAEVLEEAKLIKIGDKEISSIFKTNPNIAIDIISMLANNIRRIKDTMLQMAYGTVRYRTAKSLLVLSKKTKINNILISRYDLASFTGVAKETLIRTLSDFKDEGLIETSRSFIKIIDKNKLNQIK